MTEVAAAVSPKSAERDRLRGLLEQFGSLLTERQVSMMRSYAVDGLSFSQIAREQGVSRQAVHEAVRAAERTLTDYESKLAHLAGSNTGIGLRARATAGLNGSRDIEQVFARLEQLKLKIARSGIIYSVDWIRREIDGVMGLLAEGEKTNEAEVRTEASLR